MRSSSRSVCRRKRVEVDPAESSGWSKRWNVMQASDDAVAAYPDRRVMPYRAV